jgi:hypothetical protein
MEELSQRMQEIGQAVYGAGQNGAGDAPGEDAEGRKEEAGTVEGEFREV